MKLPRTKNPVSLDMVELAAQLKSVTFAKASHALTEDAPVSAQNTNFTTLSWQSASTASEPRVCQWLLPTTAVV